MEEENPLVKCLPPATDYIEYLTILEYNTTRESLPLLNNLLQDVELTSNIGWDLLQILLPLLPESRQCLETVSRLGNPREVILKATETLRAIQWEDEQTDGSEVETALESSAAHVSLKDVPVSIQQFSVLVFMLDILHGRIKTQYPSRFLSTTFQSISATMRQMKLLHYTLFNEHRDHMMQEIFPVVSKDKKKPILPPRAGSSQKVVSAPPKAIDPEAHVEPVSANEEALIERLRQAFLTELLELYVSDTLNDDNTIIPGMAWSIRFQLQADPKRAVSGDMSISEQFLKNGTRCNLQQKTTEKFSAIASRLAMTSDVLFSTAIGIALTSASERVENNKPVEKPPEGIPLSALGCLYLLAARYLEHGRSLEAERRFNVFPDHAAILRRFIGANDDLTTIGSEPLCIVDAVLVFGLIAAEHGHGHLEEIPETEFLQYLQTMSLLSANTPHPSLRYYAHFITSSVLASHPSDAVRFGFIMDTITECPFENLQASAIGWLKEEIVKANQTDAPAGLFSKSETLESFAAAIFTTPDFITAGSPEDRWGSFRSKMALHLAALNFYYMLLSSNRLRECLGVLELHQKLQIDERYLQAFRGALAEFDEMEDPQDSLDLMLLGDVLDRINGRVNTLGLV